MSKDVRDKIAEHVASLPKVTKKERNERALRAGHAYAAKKLTGALETLATGTGDVRARLLLASRCFVGIKREDFPPAKRKEWDAVLKTVYRFKQFFKSPTREEFFECSPKMATWGMKNITAQKAAKKVVELYWSVSQNRRYS
jgi:hypothetical protein